MSRNLSFVGAMLAALGSPMAVAAPPVASLSDICGNCRPVRMATCGGFLEGPTVDSAGKVWVTDVLNGRVLTVESTGQCGERVRTGGHPNSAKFRSDGKLLIADWQGLLVFDPVSGKLDPLPLSYAGKDIKDLNDLVVLSDGGIYFTTPNKSSFANPVGKVWYRAPDGAVRPIADGIAFPNGLAATADGETVLVSEFGAKRIIAYPAVTARSPFSMSYVFAHTVGGVGIDGMMQDEQGRLFGAVMGAGEVVVYDKLGRLIGSIHLPDDGGLFVTNIAAGRDALYITEAQKGEIWQVKLRH